MLSRKHLRVLTEIGLTEQEALIYTAALSAGPSTILKLSRASAIKRTTTYSVVDTLKQKGLMRLDIRGFKKLYAAETPDKLQMMLQYKQTLLDDTLPEFMALLNLKGNESFIKHYEGVSAIKSVYESLIKDVRPKEDYLVISDQQRWLALDSKFFSDFTRRRAKLDINIKLLLVDNESARSTLSLQKQHNYTIKLLPPYAKLTTNMVCIPQRVVINQLVPPVFALVIENKSIVRMIQEMYKIIWEAV